MVADSFMQQLIASLARRTPVLDEPVPYPSGAADAKDSSRRGAGPILLGEDRPDFERTLDEVLKADPPGRTEHLNAEQLRSMAITAQEAIVAKAAPEYAHYLEVREQARIAHGAEAPTVSRSSGAPVAAVITVLAPVLLGTAAAIFLLVGYVLRMASPRIAAASSLITTGWLFAAGTAASVLVAMVSLLLTALRNASVSPSHGDGAMTQEVAAARANWRQALRRRGLEPFLRDVRKAVNGGLDHDRAP